MAIFRDTYAPLLHRNALVPNPDLRQARPGESARDVAERAAARSRRHLATHHATTAALIVEPLVQGASGMVDARPALPRPARALCTRYEVLLIADEIMTGFGRTGTFFAWEQAAAPAPDFLCLSKGITGGYLPLSSVLSTDAVYDAFYDDDPGRGFLHSHSLHRQRARLPRRAGGARHLPRRRCRDREPRATAALVGARRAAGRALRGCATSASAG